MAELIIGHTTHDTATLWVRGDPARPFARVALESPDGAEVVSSPALRLDAARDFTDTTALSALQPETVYAVRARFTARRDGAGDADEVCGRLRTFPRPGDAARFSFLLGSCNLSVVSLGDLGSLAGGGVGTFAGARSLQRLHEGSRLGRRLLWIGNTLVYGVYHGISTLRRWFGREAGDERLPWKREEALVWGVFALLYDVTSFKQPEPFLPLPFETLCALVEGGRPAAAPAFLLHAGDQIYFDFPWAERAPSLEAYRRSYREAWFGEPSLRRLLTLCPQYMILDDHEIVDGFATDATKLPDDREPSQYLEPAARAYREYVHSRQPGHDQGSFSYEFEYGATRFFVLDTRTQRSIGRGEMIDPVQLCRLLSWLRKHEHALKFVVSSVPFAAQVKHKHKEGSREGDESDDKWCGRPFRAQREQIIQFLHEHRIGRLVFLVGDMHCCYHATLQIGRPHDRVTVHELGGGPFYQLQFGCRPDFVDQYEGNAGPDGKLPFRSVMRTVHGTASAVLRVKVVPGDGPEVRWQVVRTSPEPVGETAPGEAQWRPQRPPRHRPFTGRIRFEELRHL